MVFLCESSWGVTTNSLGVCYLVVFADSKGKDQVILS